MQASTSESTCFQLEVDHEGHEENNHDFASDCLPVRTGCDCGGAGSIFGLVKSQLSPENFSKVAAAVPGMNKFLKAAPPATPGGSAVSSLGSMAGGGKAGGLASLAGSFQSLGMSPGMIGKFAP